MPSREGSGLLVVPGRLWLVASTFLVTWPSSLCVAVYPLIFDRVHWLLVEYPPQSGMTAASNHIAKEPILRS